MQVHEIVRSFCHLNTWCLSPGCSLVPIYEEMFWHSYLQCSEKKLSSACFAQAIDLVQSGALPWWRRWEWVMRVLDRSVVFQLSSVGERCSYQFEQNGVGRLCSWPNLAMFCFWAAWAKNGFYIFPMAGKKCQKKTNISCHFKIL